MNRNIKITVAVIGVFISFMPIPVSAVILGGACTGINNVAGTCKSASAGGSNGCGVADTLGTGNCDAYAGLVCCSQGSPAPTANPTLTGPPDSPQVQAGPPDTGSDQNITLINPLNAGISLESFLVNILQFIVRIGAIVIILMVVFVGYKFVAAQGNSTKIEEARTMLLWTIVGALILLGAEAIAKGICATVQALSNGTGSCG